MADDDFIEWLREGATIAAPPARPGVPGATRDDAQAIDGTVEQPRRGNGLGDVVGAHDGEGEAVAHWRPDAERAVAADGQRRLWRVVAVGCAVLGIVSALAVGARWADGFGAVGTGGIQGTEGTETAGRTGAAGGAAIPSRSSQPAAAGSGSAPVAGGPPSAGGLLSAAADVTHEALEGRRRAAAAVTVRLALTAQGQTDRYVDLAVPEWVEDLGGGLAVVPVAVVLLEGRDGRWESVRTARYAVALRDEPAGPRAVGPPWPVLHTSQEGGGGLPFAEDTTPSEGPSRAGSAAAAPVPIDPPERAAAVAAALEAAGYHEIAVTGLVPGGPGEPLLQVRAEGVGPGESTVRMHEVWLHDGERLRVLGAEPVP